MSSTTDNRMSVTHQHYHPRQWRAEERDTTETRPTAFSSLQHDEGPSWFLLQLNLLYFMYVQAHPLNSYATPPRTQASRILFVSGKKRRNVHFSFSSAHGKIRLPCYGAWYRIYKITHQDARRSKRSMNNINANVYDLIATRHDSENSDAEPSSFYDSDVRSV